VPGTQPRPPTDEIVRRGLETIERLVQPHLRPEDTHKYLAVDIDTGDYELDDDDHAAVKRLRARRPAGEFYLAWVGHPVTGYIRAGR